MPSRSWQRLSRLSDADVLLAACPAPDPFLHAAFLGSLEDAGVVGPGTAWEPAHLLFEEDGKARALLPMYRKHDSRGEYVFDHGWAEAYQRHGLDYYPKLVTALPFTPVPGPRLLLAEQHRLADWLPVVLDAIKTECRTQHSSGWHGLFVEESWLEPARQAGLVRRDGCRFHWQNPGHADFNAFLATLTSKKRKDLRRERRLLQEAGIHCRRIDGRDASAADWDFFHACYVRTYHEHGQHPYLNREFFQLLAGRMPAQLMLVIAEDGEGPMASALFFHDHDTLFGRYWGSLRRANGLHFEVCYYQGMEFCMERALRDFDPGTQGEHKLLRGFAPKRTWSLHWLENAGFQEAVARFVAEEREAVSRYEAEAESLLPYRKSRE